MRYFINNDYFSICMSLTDLLELYEDILRYEDELENSTFREEYPRFELWLESCMDRNNGCLVEVNQNPTFHSDVARSLYGRVQSARSDAELALIGEISRDELGEFIDFDDEDELGIQIEFQRYKIDRGMR